MKDEEFLELLNRHRASVAAAARFTPCLYGPRERLIDNSGCIHTDLLVNTMSGTVQIGKNSFFGHGVMLITGTHDFTKLGSERVNSFPAAGRNIIIDDGVYIGSGSIVLGPAKIGRNAVVYAGSVVIHDIAAHEIHAGVPATKVGEIPKRPN